MNHSPAGWKSKSKLLVCGGTQVFKNGVATNDRKLTVCFTQKGKTSSGDHSSMIFKSPHAPVNIPDSTLTEYVLRNATSLGNKPALIDGPTGRTYTYAQLPGFISRLAAGLAEQGLKKGEVFAIFSPNLPEVPLAFHAVATLGAATTMVPPLFTDAEIIRQLEDSGARYLLTIPQLMEKAEGWPRRPASRNFL